MAEAELLALRSPNFSVELHRMLCQEAANNVREVMKKLRSGPGTGGVQRSLEAKAAGNATPDNWKGLQAVRCMPSRLKQSSLASFHLRLIWTRPLPRISRLCRALLNQLRLCFDSFVEAMGALRDRVNDEMQQVITQAILAATQRILFQPFVSSWRFKSGLQRS